MIQSYNPERHYANSEIVVRISMLWIFNGINSINRVAGHIVTIR